MHAARGVADGQHVRPNPGIGQRCGPRVPTPASNSMPSGRVTFLFTDLEGSTRQWESEPELMHQAVERHDEIAVGAIARWNGSVFSTAGDSFAAAFHQVSDAIRRRVSCNVRSAPSVGPHRSSSRLAWRFTSVSQTNVAEITRPRCESDRGLWPRAPRRHPG